MQARTVAALATVAALILAGCSKHRASTLTGVSGPTQGGSGQALLYPGGADEGDGELTCAWPSTNLYYADISGLGVHSSSSAWIATITVTTPLASGSDTGFVHCNIGTSGSITLGHFVNHAPSAATTMHVTGPGTDAATYYNSDGLPAWPASYKGYAKYPYIYGLTYLQQGDPDKHCIMLNVNSCMLYECYYVTLYGSSDSVSCKDGVRWNMTSNNLLPSGCSSADEAGLPLAIGLFSYDDLFTRHSIPHALRCQTYGANIAKTSGSPIWPAGHTSASGGNYTIKTNPIPMGARIRLSSAFTATHAESLDAGFMTLTACMKKYGAVVSDRGSSEFALSGIGDTRFTNTWVNTVFNAAGCFTHDWLPYLQVVDESGHMVSASSMQWQ